MYNSDRKKIDNINYHIINCIMNYYILGVPDLTNQPLIADS